MGVVNAANNCFRPGQLALTFAVTFLLIEDRLHLAVFADKPISTQPLWVLSDFREFFPFPF